MTISATKSVRELAVEIPTATSIFERLGIDYCCGGDRSLTAACETAGVAVDRVVRSLEEAAQYDRAADSFVDWKAEPLSHLISYIVEKHHVFTRQELNRLEPVLEKVCAVHGSDHPELFRIQEIFKNLKQELLTHMLKEEQVLFPHILRIETAKNRSQAAPTPVFGTIVNPIRMMTLEHDTAGEALRAIREAASDFVTPSSACVSYQSLYEGLQVLERDLHQHIHLENNVMFPRAVEIEQSLL